MSDWKKICCAIDFSDPSRVGMEEAAALARRLGAELTLLHVYEAHAPSADILLSRFEQAAPQLESEMQAWQRDAEQIASRPVRPIILSGNAAAEILRFAREDAFDLLVVTTRGLTGLARVVLGSVAERVVREAECPVLVFRQRSRAAE